MANQQEVSLKEKCQLLLQAIQLVTIDPLLLENLRRKIFSKFYR